jgi:hypothetical protein
MSSAKRKESAAVAKRKLTALAKLYSWPTGESHKLLQSAEYQKSGLTPLGNAGLGAAARATYVALEEFQKNRFHG